MPHSPPPMNTIFANFISAPLLCGALPLAFDDSALAHDDVDKRLDVSQPRLEVDDAGAQQVAASDNRIRDEGVAPALQAVEQPCPARAVHVPDRARRAQPTPTRHV